MNFESLGDLIKLWAGITLETMLQYVVVAGLFHLGAAVLARSPLAGRKIQDRIPPRRLVLREFQYSLRSCAVFALVGAACVLAKKAGISREYDAVSDYGWPYLFLSVYLMFTIHDIWHYALHRLCHEVPFLYRHVHKTHHTFATPTPWSADAFHPLDALVNISFLPLFALLLPVQTLVLKGYLVLAVVLNTLGHSGYELMPKGLTRHWLFRYLNTTTAHDLHHQKVHFNYGLYTNILDRLLGTYHPATATTYERLTDAVSVANEEITA